MNIASLPHLNAVLNALALICLLVGYYQIKIKKDEDIHKKWMIRSFVFSALFLASYLTYHFNVPSKKFPDLGLIKTIYLSILIPHIILAALMLPFILMTFYYAFKDMRKKHIKIARITFPIWVFVSASGIVVYLMLYQIFA